MRAPAIPCALEKVRMRITRGSPASSGGSAPAGAKSA